MHSVCDVFGTPAACVPETWAPSSGNPSSLIAFFRRRKRLARCSFLAAFLAALESSWCHQPQCHEPNQYMRWRHRNPPIADDKGRCDGHTFGLGGSAQ